MLKEVNRSKKDQGQSNEKVNLIDRILFQIVLNMRDIDHSKQVEESLE